LRGIGSPHIVNVLGKRKSLSISVERVCAWESKIEGRDRIEINRMIKRTVFMCACMIIFP
jgi:hypothetical protein